LKPSVISPLCFRFCPYSDWVAVHTLVYRPDCNDVTSSSWSVFDIFFLYSDSRL